MKCMLCRRTSQETEFPADSEAGVYRRKNNRLCNDCQIWYVLAIAVFVLAAGFDIGKLLM